MTRCTLCLNPVHPQEFLDNDHVCAPCGKALAGGIQDWTIQPYPGLRERLANTGLD